MMQFNKIYVGWVLSINGTEHTVAGSNTLRGETYYVLAKPQNVGGFAKITRESLLKGLNDNSIKYITNIVKDVVKSSGIAFS
jgi:uncharacterized protein YaaQ